MKTPIKVFSQLALLATSLSVMAQQPTMQYYRANNKNGINVFETTKNDTSVFTVIKVRVGGNFTQDFHPFCSILFQNVLFFMGLSVCA